MDLLCIFFLKEEIKQFNKCFIKIQRKEFESIYTLYSFQKNGNKDEDRTIY